MRHRVRWKEPVGRLETRPVPRGRGQGAKTGGDRRQVQDAVERHRRREQARHRLKLPSQDRCRAPRRAGHGCRESIPRVASSCRYLIGVTLAANAILGPTLSVRVLPGAGGHLQPLRPRPDLLRGRLRASGPISLDPGGGQALPNQPSRPLCPRRTQPPLPRSTEECDASGFPRTGAR